MSVCYMVNDEKLIKQSKSSRFNAKPTLFFMKALKYSGRLSYKVQK